MLNIRISLIAMLLWVLATQVGLGQSQGHWRGNQYVGFMPKHLQHQDPDVLREAATTYQALEEYQPPQSRQRMSQNSNQVVPAQYAGTTGEVISGSVYPEGIVSDGTITDDSAWNGSACDGSACDGSACDGSACDGCMLGMACNGGECDSCVSDFGWPVAGCCGNGRMWARVELLSWDAKGLRVPALATSSPAGTLQDVAGVLPAATTLFGGNTLNNQSRTGARFKFGAWLDPMQTRAIEFTYAFLERESESFSRSATDGTILARPFFNTGLNAEDSRLIVFPAVVDGTLNIDVETEFHTAEVLFRRPVVCTDVAQISWTLGYRYANLTDTIRIQENTTSLLAANNGATFDLTDAFETKNNFHGGQIGLLIIESPLPRWSIEMGAKFAYGRTLSDTTISGTTTNTTAAGISATNQGGLLSQETNIGRHEDNVASTLGELSVAIRHQIPCGIIGSVGYSALYWSDLGRGGDAIDRTVNPTQIPPGTLVGTERPAFDFNSSDFWARGVNFGLEFSF